MTNWPIKKIGEDRKGAVYFLIRDILSCFPDDIENNLVYTLNQHLISKEATRQILKDEIQEKKPQFRILAGTLIVQNAFLRQLPRAAFYEVIEVVDALKYCFQNDSRKTIKRLSAQTILRLFLALYFEFIITPLRRKEGTVYIKKFKKFFTKKDIIKIMNTESIYPRFIFEQQGINLGIGDEVNIKLNNILDEFYLAENK